MSSLSFNNLLLKLISCFSEKAKIQETRAIECGIQKKVSNLRWVFKTKIRSRIKAGMVVHPVTQVIGEQALVDILDLSKVAWTCWGCFYTQQWTGAEDGILLLFGFLHKQQIHH